MNGHDEHDDISWKGHVGPRMAAVIGAVAGMAASRRRVKGAVVGGAIGWAVAHLLNRRRERKAGVVDVTGSDGGAHEQAV